MSKTAQRRLLCILWPPDAKNQLIGKDPDAGKDWRQETRGWQRMTWLEGITDSMDVNLSQLQEMVKDREAERAAIHGVAKSRTWPSYFANNNVSPEEEPGPYPKAALLFLDYASFVSLQPLLSLISNYLNLSIRTQGRSRRPNEASVL